MSRVSSMACRISELGLGCRDPEVLARFWCEVLDFVVLDREDDGTLEIGPREGFGGPQPTIVLSCRDEPERGNPGCTSMSTPPSALGRQSSNAFSNSVLAWPTSAKRVRNRGTLWPTPKAMSSACSRPASPHSDAHRLHLDTRSGPPLRGSESIVTSELCDPSSR